MPDLGNLKELLEDEDSVSDLDWLDVDEEAYREFEKLPEQNLNSIPDLVETWGSREEADQYSLSPTNQEPREKNTPFWSERPSSVTGPTEEERKAIVENFVKEKIASGHSTQECLNLLSNSFDSQILASSKGRIKSAIKEEGLSGVVYVDSELFPDCHQGEGQDFVRKHASKARFVKGKDSCRDCVFNKNGACSRFQKEIVFDIEYNQELWEEYRDKFKGEGRDLSVVDKDASPREKIKQASSAPYRNPDKDQLDYKPVQPHPADQITEKEAQEELSQADAKERVIGNVYRKRKIRETALQMMADGAQGGPMNPSLKDRLENNPELDRLQKRANLLGPLYLDLSYFDTRKEAAQFFKEQDVPVSDRMLIGAPQNEGKTAEKQFSLRDPRVLNSIVQRYASQKFGHDYKQKQDLMKRMASYLVRASDEKLRKFAQATFSQPVPQEVAEYSTFGKPIYDPTEGITTKEAWNELKAASDTSKSISSTSSDHKEVEKFARHMMKASYHDENILDRINSDERLASFREDLHLLGKVYTDSSYFTSKESYNRFISEHSDLASLPDKEGQDIEQFLKSNDKARQILKSRVKDLDGLEDVTASVPNMTELARWACKVSTRKEMPEYAGKVYKTQYQKKGDGRTGADADKSFASVVNSPDFDVRDYIASREDSKQALQRLIDELGKESVRSLFEDRDSVEGTKDQEDQDYQGQVYKDQHKKGREDQNLTEEQAKRVVDATEEKSVKVVDFDLKDFIKASDNGEEVLQTLVNRLNRESIQAFYLDADGVTASKVNENPDLARGVISRVTDDNFDSQGLSEFPSRMVGTKVGRWMRDRLIEGKTGADLSDALKTAFDETYILDKAPIISAMREEEGWYGKTYSTADSYSNCREGRDAISDSVNQIVKSDKCSDCVYNRGDSCGLYQEALVDQPEYNSGTVRNALNRKLNEGGMSLEASERVMDLDVDPKTKTRIAHMGDVSISSDERQTIAAPFSGYYGGSEEADVKKKDVETMLRFASEKAQSGDYDRYHLKKLISNNFEGEVIMAASDSLKEILNNMDSSNIPDVIDYDSTKAASGLDDMEQFNLMGQDMNASDIEVDEEHDRESIEISELGGMNLDF